jgi:hypothetical protein
MGIMDGPGQNNFDLSVTKRFPLRWPRENSLLEFRSEFFNASNHPQFGEPDGEFTSHIRADLLHERRSVHHPVCAEIQLDQPHRELCK